jgi:hypothetical protein
VRRAEATGQAALVLGDFNISDQTRAYWLATRRLRDSFREAGRGMGWTFAEGLHLDDIAIPGPFTRIDFILHTADLRRPSACGLLHRVGSCGYVAAWLYRVAGNRALISFVPLRFVVKIPPTFARLVRYNASSVVVGPNHWRFLRSPCPDGPYQPWSASRRAA